MGITNVAVVVTRKSFCWQKSGIFSSLLFSLSHTKFVLLPLTLTTIKIRETKYTTFFVVLAVVVVVFVAKNRLDFRIFVRYLH